MVKKRRVFQVARELKISNEAVIEALCKKDKSIRNQMSAVSEDLYEELCEFYRGDPASSETVHDFRQQLKERQMLEELRRTKARQELQERIRFATQLAEERPERIRLAKALEDQKEAEARAAKEAEADEKKAKEISAQKEAEVSVVDLISKAKKEIDAKEKAKDKKVAAVAREREPEKSPADSPATTEAKKITEKEKAGKTASPEKKPATPAAVAPADSGTAAKAGEKKSSGGKDKGRRKGKKKKRKIDEEEIQENIRQTLAAMDETKPKRRRRRVRDDGEEMEEVDLSVIRVSEFISAAELAELIDVDSGQIITKCLELGMMVSINQRLDMDTIEAVADEFDFAVEKIEEYGAEIIDQYEDVEADIEQAEPRSPVVTIMGHVDHGKTSLLDFIRKSNIIKGESGGITQHIGAYVVSVKDKNITFLDTPGHEAFTAMRARGAQVTDLVILVVAADDGVQPQTIEAINHAMAASVPIVVAINKIDKPAANSELIKKQLSEQNVLVEEWGGKYQAIEISAKTGQGVDALMDLILLEAELLELKANPNRKAQGVIIESKLDKGRGAVATVLVQRGTLKVGDLFIAGNQSGKVRAMYNERNRKESKAPPSTPVQVIGFGGVPQAGDSFLVLESEREVREISSKRRQLRREQEFRRHRHTTLDQISQEIKEGRVKELNIILKADVDGSNEALSDALMKLSNDEVSVNVIHKAVGGISESDVLFASASQAVIIGFQVRPSIQARELANKEQIDIRLYDIIYSVVEDVRAALEGMLEPEITDELTATIEVRETFKVPKAGTIAGSYVVSGKATRNDFIRLYRDDKLLHEAKLSSLKRFKEDVKEVAAGFECGIGLKGFDDIKVGDIMETYRKIETARKLE